jgi:hypothetical protein
MQENKYSFRIKFEKDQHSINAETYVQSLISLSTIIREVNYQSGNAPAVAVNVLAQDAGSFDVALELVEVIRNNHSLIVNGVAVLSGIVTTVVGVIQLKQHFSKADDTKTEINGDQVNIKDTNGDVIFQTNNITYNLYKNNQAVNDAVSSQFQAVANDEEMEAVTITAGDSVVRLEKEDFETLAEKRIIEVEDTEEVTVPAQLTISKLVLDNSERKWEFVYQGTKVSAKIDDDSFWKKVFAGEVSFANGDILVGDLKIIREYDSVLGAYLNKDYSVLNVRQHLPRTNRTQTSIEDIEKTDV